jgi:hypothetical protein
MRNAGTHSGKDLAHEIALLERQLDDLSSSLTGSGESILARGEAVLGTVKKAKDTLIEQTETRPLTTLAVVAGIGSWQACFIVGTSVEGLPPIDCRGVAFGPPDCVKTIVLHAGLFNRLYYDEVGLAPTLRATKGLASR